MLAAEPGHAGPYFLWPLFGPAGHPLLDLYRHAGIGSLAAGLLSTGLDVQEPDAAQIATTIPPWPHRPGRPHVDGLTPPCPDGRPGTLAAGRSCSRTTYWLSGHQDRWPEAVTNPLLEFT
jgi:hypothetical protein